MARLETYDESGLPSIYWVCKRRFVRDVLAKADARAVAVREGLAENRLHDVRVPVNGEAIELGLSEAWRTEPVGELQLVQFTAECS